MNIRKWNVLRNSLADSNPILKSMQITPANRSGLFLLTFLKKTALESCRLNLAAEKPFCRAGLLGSKQVIQELEGHLVGFVADVLAGKVQVVKPVLNLHQTDIGP